jgi:uncharacterized protein YbaP (TraB family)
MNQIIKISISIAFTLTTLFLSAQESENSLLWKIEGENIKPSYLFGTVHMMPKEQFEMPQKVINAIENSNLIVLELDMDDPNFQAEFMKHAMLPEGKEISDFMDEEEYKFLNTFLTTKMGVGLEQIKNYNPLMLTSMTLIAHMGKEFGSFEMEFIKIAKQQKIEILGLETVKDQMDAINSQSYDKQIDDLIKMLKDDEMTSMLDNMITLYKSENYKTLYDFLNDFFKQDEATINALLFNRNENWIPKIETYSKDKNVFYGVGAGHLGGEKGVIELLKQRGYKLIPVLN